MKLGALAAGLVLVAGGVVGCGGDGDGGDRPTRDEFCAAFQAFGEDVAQAEDGADEGRVLKDAADKVEEVGTPEDIPADAQAGFELTLATIDDLPDDATEADIATAQQDYSEEDEEKVQAFTDYLSKTCPDLGTG